MKTDEQEGKPDRSFLSTRWKLIAFYWLVQSCLIYFGWAFFMIESEHVNGPEGKFFGKFTAAQYAHLATDGWFAQYAVPLALGVAACQALFLWPVAKPTYRNARGANLWCSVGVAGLAMAALIFAAYAALSQALSMWAPSIAPHWQSLAWAPVVVAPSWLTATLLIWKFVTRRQRETALSRLASLLLLGTVIEVIAIMPIDVMARRKESCYCWSGTIFGLGLCAGVGVFVIGPIILLPILARRRKRWYMGRCDACGYDMAATMTAERCPECGAGWKAPRAA